jgi:hypothetical protein
MNNKNILLELLEQNKLILKKLDNFENKFGTFENKFGTFENKLTNFDKSHKNLVASVRNIENYIKKESNYYEYKVTNWLLFYLKNMNKEYIYYIPCELEVPRDLFIENVNIKKQTITDIDGIIIGTNNKYQNLLTPENKKESNIYNIYIIQSKHYIDIKKIKTKIKQIIKLKNIINDPSSPYNIRKFSTGQIYLYFSVPFIEEKVLDFINKEQYLDENYWKYNHKNIIKSNDILFLKNNIKFIVTSNNEFDFDYIS